MLHFRNYSAHKILYKINNLQFSETQRMVVRNHPYHTNECSSNHFILILLLGHRTSSSSGPNNSLYGNTTYSSTPQISASSTSTLPTFPLQQPQQTNIFSSQQFPPQFPPPSNPFGQPSFATSEIHSFSSNKSILFICRFIKFLCYATYQSAESISGRKTSVKHDSIDLLSFIYSRTLLNNNNQQLNNYPINSASHGLIQLTHFFNI